MFSINFSSHTNFSSILKSKIFVCFFAFFLIFQTNTFARKNFQKKSRPYHILLNNGNTFSKDEKFSFTFYNSSNLRVKKCTVMFLVLDEDGFTIFDNESAYTKVCYEINVAPSSSIELFFEIDENIKCTEDETLTISSLYVSFLEYEIESETENNSDKKEQSTWHDPYGLLSPF
ncbi:MAG: hypothetical protein IKI31_00185 [Treponema sp.]|nr:hypothetical protein [Treponema sp.]